MSLLSHAKSCLNQQTRHAALNAFICAAESAKLLPAAEASDVRQTKGKPLSSIDGRLIGIKDNICTSDLPTTCGSANLDGYVSPFAATVVEKIEKAGGIIAGKTNLDEFGMGSHSLNSAFGPTVSNLQRKGEGLSAGGSSGGSAVAVATEQCWAALGTDTGGSVRLPASYCGVVGFKPSYGLVSRHGVVAYANSLDTVGVLAPNSEIVRQVFEVIDGFDERDPTSLSKISRERIQEAVIQRKSGLRIGIPLEFNTSELDSAVREAWLETLKNLQREGHSIHAVSLPSTKQALSAYYVIAPAEASSNLAKYDGVRYGNYKPKGSAEEVLYASTRGSTLGPEVQRRILLGSFSLSASAIDNYFIQAQKVRRLLQRDFDTAFSMRNPLLDDSKEGEQGIDVLLSPTATSPPPSVDAVSKSTPLETYRHDVLTVPASLAGLPAISVPVALPRESSEDEVKTVGMQIIGQFGDDEKVLQAAGILEKLAV